MKRAEITSGTPCLTPSCNSPCELKCTCTLKSTRCTQGHSWHICAIHNIPVSTGMTSIHKFFPSDYAKCSCISESIISDECSFCHDNHIVGVKPCACILITKTCANGHQWSCYVDNPRQVIYGRYICKCNNKKGYCFKCKGVCEKMGDIYSNCPNGHENHTCSVHNVIVPGKKPDDWIGRCSCPKEHNFCSHCGKSEKCSTDIFFCTHCGADMKQTSKYCSQCGRRK
jgi:hypothetical protein